MFQFIRVVTVGGRGKGEKYNWMIKSHVLSSVFTISWAAAGASDYTECQGGGGGGGGGARQKCR